MTIFIYCASGNPKYARTAMQYGWMYGSQLLKATPAYHPQFVDQDWKNPDFITYLARIKYYVPDYATITDLEHAEQLDMVLHQAEQVAPYVKQGIILIPKVNHIMNQLPESILGKRIIIGYSVPSRYGGTHVPTWEFGTRPVHLLGGSPKKQFALMRYLNVVSLDNNYISAISHKFIMFYAKRSYHYLRESIMNQLAHPDEPIACFTLSLMNMNAEYAGFGGIIRFAVPEDLPHIKRIAAAYPSQLGFVNLATLRDALSRHTLLVATLNEVVVGFVTYRPRKDGMNVIYELATSRAHLRQRIASGLLASVPQPTRLKTTVDNAPALALYLQHGFQILSTEQGRKRMLHVLERPTTYPAIPLS